MQAVTPVIPDVKLPIHVFAKDQREYTELPCYLSHDLAGTITIRWKLTWRERLSILLHGNVFHQVMAFGHKLQPIKLSTECPLNADECRHQSYKDGVERAHGAE